MVICVACQRRCDPNKSFCANCGSAVFVDANEPGARGPRPRREWAAAARNQPTNIRTIERPTVNFPIGGLIKWAVFLFIVWKAWGVLVQFPEVRTMVDAVERGETPNVQPAIEALRNALQTAVNQLPPPERSQETRPDDGAPAAAAPVPESSSPAVAPTETPAAPVVEPARGGTAPDTARSSAPRVVRRVMPTYTPAATRAKIQGTVLLKGVVQVDGTVSNISIVRSLDDEFGLDQEAIKALQQWRFEPAIRNGQPVPSSMQVEMTFGQR